MGPSRCARVVYYYGGLTPRIATRTVMVLTIERNLVLIAASLTLDVQLASCTVSHAKYLDRRRAKYLIEGYRESATLFIEL
jgi:hypothetical protein